MPPSQTQNRFDLIERELNKALSEYPALSALDRLKFVRSLVNVMKSGVDDDEATIPVLEIEVRSAKEYRRR